MPSEANVHQWLGILRSRPNGTRYIGNPAHVEYKHWLLHLLCYSKTSARVVAERNVTLKLSAWPVLP